VEFEDGAVVGLLDMARMERELSTIVGRRVDLKTAEDLSRYFRRQVLDLAEVQYGRAG
jgi:predicted nucleotidyltransferase